MARIGLALLIVDDKILLFKRSEHPDDINPGKYGMVGGHVKDDETPLEGTKREAKEEANLDLKKLKYLDNYKHKNEGNGEEDRLYVYTQELENTDDIYLNPEHTGFKLFKPDELDKKGIIPTTKFMYHDYVKKFGKKKSKK
jgi:8-oxo-dGTP pyrophosphatase MutT (NUDIX family)